MELWLERLAEHHHLTDFSCGESGLDDWLKRHGLAAQLMDTARTFLLMSEGHVLGYFCLTMGSVRRREPPARLVRGTPQYPVGMVLLARLAIDRPEQGKGLGSLLLSQAMLKGLSAGEAVAARLIVVDAIHEKAAAFYLKHGFIPAPENPLRLYRRMKDLQASLR